MGRQPRAAAGVQGGGAARSWHGGPPGFPWSTEAGNSGAEGKALRRRPAKPRCRHMPTRCFLPAWIPFYYLTAKLCAPSIPDLSLHRLGGFRTQQPKLCSRWGPACALGTSPQRQCTPTSPRGHPRLGRRHSSSANLPAGSGRGHRALRLCKLNLAFGRD